MTASVHQNEIQLSSILLQLVIMIAAARLLNSAFRRIGQPGVIGEIVAGLMLGPSLFGHFWPALSASLFGAKAAAPISILSQIGLILLMFQIGADFEFAHLTAPRNRAAVIAITVASVAAPFGLGLALGHWSGPALAPGINPLVYALFCGVALAITAVPILGRILRQFGLTRHELGVVAIASAALNDVIGWVMLAGVSAFAVAKFSGLGMALQVAGIFALAVGGLVAARPLVDRLIKAFPITDGDLAPNLIAIVLVIIFLCAISTFRLGVFAIFGGFIAGLIFHRHTAFVEAWRRQVGQLVLVFFLPIFFTYTGLRTNILGLTSSDAAWLAAFLAAAILGKLIPVYAAARLTGFGHHQASVLGVLMNTRALMELIVLNIGLDLGFMPQKVFTMLVVMAVVTTVMTGPLLTWLLPRTGHVIPVGIEA